MRYRHLKLYITGWFDDIARVSESHFWRNITGWFHYYSYWVTRVLEMRYCHLKLYITGWFDDIAIG